MNKTSGCTFVAISFLCTLISGISVAIAGFNNLNGLKITGIVIFSLSALSFIVSAYICPILISYKRKSNCVNFTQGETDDVCCGWWSALGLSVIWLVGFGFAACILSGNIALILTVGIAAGILTLAGLICIIIFGSCTSHMAIDSNEKLDYFAIFFSFSCIIFLLASGIPMLIVYINNPYVQNGYDSSGCPQYLFPLSIIYIVSGGLIFISQVIAMWIPIFTHTE